MKPCTAEVTCEVISGLNLRFQQHCQSHHVFGCTFAAASSVCGSDIISLILSVLEIKMVSGRLGLKVSQKRPVILVKKSDFPHIHSRAMWFSRCWLPVFTMDLSLSRVIVILAHQALLLS